MGESTVVTAYVLSDDEVRALFTAQNGIRLYDKQRGIYVQI